MSQCSRRWFYAEGVKVRSGSAYLRFQGRWCSVVCTKPGPNEVHYLDLQDGAELVLGGLPSRVTRRRQNRLGASVFIPRPPGHPYRVDTLPTLTFYRATARGRRGQSALNLTDLEARCESPQAYALLCHMAVAGLGGTPSAYSRTLADAWAGSWHLLPSPTRTLAERLVAVAPHLGQAARRELLKQLAGPAAPDGHAEARQLLCCQYLQALWAPLTERAEALSEILDMLDLDANEQVAAATLDALGRLDTLVKTPAERAVIVGYFRKVATESFAALAGGPSKKADHWHRYRWVALCDTLPAPGAAFDEADVREILTDIRGVIISDDMNGRDPRLHQMQAGRNLGRYFAGCSSAGKRAELNTWLECSSTATVLISALTTKASSIISKGESRASHYLNTALDPSDLRIVVEAILTGRPKPTPVSMKPVIDDELDPTLDSTFKPYAVTYPRIDPVIELHAGLAGAGLVWAKLADVDASYVDAAWSALATNPDPMVRERLAYGLLPWDPSALAPAHEPRVLAMAATLLADPAAEHAVVNQLVRGPFAQRSWADPDALVPLLKSLVTAGSSNARIRLAGGFRPFASALPVVARATIMAALICDPDIHEGYVERLIQDLPALATVLPNGGPILGRICLDGLRDDSRPVVARAIAEELGRLAPHLTTDDLLTLTKISSEHIVPSVRGSFAAVAPAVFGELFLREDRAPHS